MDSLRDLGIVLSSDGSFGAHINKVISKCRQRIGWMNRSFHRNTVEFKRSAWRSHIQSLIDYGSQIWAPIDNNNIVKLEQILKSYSKGILGLESNNYWDRLQILKVNSIQRRMESYRMLYIWKVITGKVPNFGLSWDSNSRRGWMVSIRNYKVTTPTLAKI